MRKHWKGAAALFAAVAAVVAVIGCTTGTTATTGTTGSTGGPIKVGSKMDGEGALLGQMIIALLENKGLPVTDMTRTGGTDVVRKALLSGQIDVYPEYTANALLVFNKDTAVDPAVLQSAQKTYEKAKELDAANGVVWLTPAPANNTWAVAIPRTLAEKNNLVSMADWAAYINNGGSVKIVGSQEFFTSAAAMPAFEKMYGFKLRAEQTMALATGDTPVTEKAAAQGTDGANAAMAYGTDGAIAALDLLVLSDPKGAQPVYQPAPTLLKTTAQTYPEIAQILDPVFEKLDLATLQALNGQIAVEGKNAKTVARDWLTSEGLLK
jgi:osmoprotectant transport system substrate-binding protein